jgi:hypothetical protein
VAAKPQASALLLSALLLEEHLPFPLSSHTQHQCEPLQLLRGCQRQELVLVGSYKSARISRAIVGGLLPSAAQVEVDSRGIAEVVLIGIVKSVSEVGVKVLQSRGTNGHNVS